MKKIFFLTVLVFCSMISSGQTGNTSSISSDSLSDKGFDGSFQVICSSRTTELFTTDIHPLIESLRSDTEVVMYQYSPLSTFRIFPRNIINSPNWVPVTNIYIYPSKDDILMNEKLTER